jgi:hypothetical protein
MYYNVLQWGLARQQAKCRIDSTLIVADFSKGMIGLSTLQTRRLLRPKCGWRRLAVARL